MKRLICWMIGHKWPALHVTRDGLNLIITTVGTCLRCGKKGDEQ